MRVAGTAQAHILPQPKRPWIWNMSDQDVESIHSPVLLEEVLNYLRPELGGLFIDATFGLGGHAQALLSASPQVELLGIDRDSEALARAAARLADFRGRYHLVHANNAQITEIATQKGVQSCSGILADLGVSSLQFDSADRGFSFQREGPLDMRMDRDAELTAGEIVNHYCLRADGIHFWRDHELRNDGQQEHDRNQDMSRGKGIRVADRHAAVKH